MRKKDAATSFTAASDRIYLNIIFLAVPAILESLSRIAAQYFDAAMVGSLGAYATAAVGINSSTTVLINSFLTAISVGFSVQVAIAIGSGQQERVKKIVQQALLLSFVAGVIVSSLMQIIGQYSPIWLGGEKDVVPYAVNYIRIVAAATIFQSVSATFSGVLRGAGNTRIPFLINFVSNIVNIVGNYLLIYPTHTILIFGGNIVIPGAGLGVTGAATATAVSIAVSGLGMFIYILFSDTPVKLKLNGIRGFDFEIIQSTCKISIPIAFESISLAMGQVVLTKMVATLGTIAIASHYITNNVATFAYQTSMGFSHAGTTLVAQCVGADNKSLAYRYGVSSLKVGILISISFSTIIFIAANNLVALFSVVEKIIVQTTFLVKLDAVFEPLFAVSTVLCGVFRGYTDTKFPFKVAFFGIIVTRLSLGYFLGYIMHLGLRGIWYAIMADITLRSIMCLWRLRRYRPN